MFDPELLATFVAVAETGSFTRAAERIGLSQPTVSQHVQRLEAAARRNLVDRDTRRLRLTDNGDAMLGFARTILAIALSASAGRRQGPKWPAALSCLLCSRRRSHLRCTPASSLAFAA